MKVLMVFEVLQFSTRSVQFLFASWVAEHSGAASSYVLNAMMQ